RRDWHLYDFIPDSEKAFSRSTFAFGQKNLEALKVSFHPASRHNVIPDTKVTIPEEYILSNINHDLLASPTINVENFTEISDNNNHVKTFVDKLHDVAKNSRLVVGRNSDHPLSNHEGAPAEPEFTININLKKIALIGVEDKHLQKKNLYKASLFGEAQIAGEILASGHENILEVYEGYMPDQEMFAFRVISTFYQTTISTLY
ncbi:5504_t:CDS:2, partial [Paraglomus occultum]